MNEDEYPEDDLVYDLPAERLGDTATSATNSGGGGTGTITLLRQGVEGWAADVLQVATDARIARNALTAALAGDPASILELRRALGELSDNTETLLLDMTAHGIEAGPEPKSVTLHEIRAFGLDRAPAMAAASPDRSPDLFATAANGL